MLGHMSESRGEIARAGSGSNGGDRIRTRGVVELFFEGARVILLLNVEAFMLVGVAILNGHQRLMADATRLEAFVFVSG